MVRFILSYIIIVAIINNSDITTDVIPVSISLDLRHVSIAIDYVHLGTQCNNNTTYRFCFFEVNRRKSRCYGLIGYRVH